MTALFDSQDPQDSNQQSPNEYDTYVPEREFVLMPLFRRIGERLGLRRSQLEEPVHTEQHTEAATAEPMTAEQPSAPPPSAVAPALREAEIVIPASATSESQALASREVSGAVSSIDHANAPKRSMAAPVMEATRKVSGALSGAAHWFAEKQESLLHRAKAAEIPAEDLLRAPKKEPIAFPKIESAAPMPQPAIPSEEPAPAIPPAREMVEPVSVPALQREMAWEGHEARSAHAAAEQRPAALNAPTPQTATWWQHRIDWSKYLTSKRVALLGALAMAALLILGISLARRPAADMLPQQTTTQPPEPGGVTLSTHPTVTRDHPHPPATAPARVRRAHAAVDGGGPEVVTHYYHQKPSPVHQATANSDGVHRYSDLN